MKNKRKILNLNLLQIDASQYERAGLHNNMVIKELQFSHILNQSRDIDFRRQYSDIVVK